MFVAILGNIPRFFCFLLSLSSSSCMKLSSESCILSLKVESNKERRRSMHLKHHLIGTWAEERQPLKQTTHSSWSCFCTFIATMMNWWRGGGSMLVFQRRRRGEAMRRWRPASIEWVRWKIQTCTRPGTWGFLQRRAQLHLRTTHTRAQNDVATFAHIIRDVLVNNHVTPNLIGARGSRGYVFAIVTLRRGLFFSISFFQNQVQRHLALETCNVSLTKVVTKVMNLKNETHMAYEMRMATRAQQTRWSTCRRRTDLFKNCYLLQF